MEILLGFLVGWLMPTGLAIVFLGAVAVFLIILAGIGTWEGTKYVADSIADSRKRSRPGSKTAKRP